MKTRQGFVSNSSSSSYVCDCCGETESGWDLGLSDAEMFYGQCGHTLHDSCAKLTEEGAEKISQEDRYDFPSKYYECPICNMEVFLESDLLKYTLMQLDLTKEELQKDMKETFENLDIFYRDLEGRKENEN
jgi:hypothetical protein